jgi:hypothetical protein
MLLFGAGGRCGARFRPKKKRTFYRKKKPLYNRDIRKVRKRQHQYPEFGHTQGEIQKKFISIQREVNLRKKFI